MTGNELKYYCFVFFNCHGCRFLCRATSCHPVDVPVHVWFDLLSLSALPCLCFELTELLQTLITDFWAT